MNISDALLYVIYKNNGLNNPELLSYIKQLKQYGLIEINKDGLSYNLTDKGMNKLINNKIINN